MGIFGTGYRNLRRYNHILRVLVRYGFEDAVSHLEENRRIRWIRRLIPSSIYQRARSLSKWEKMRMVCEELGPTFIKFGQILSNRPDLLPEGLIAELAKLQDGVAPLDTEVVRQVIHAELGKPADEVFRQFSSSALASASIAQVHIATLHSGEKVAVKVQRPGIREIIESDIQAMYHVAEVLSRRVPSVRNFDPVGLIRTFEESIRRELDFVHESVSLRRFTENFQASKGDKATTTAPTVYLEYSTDKVLVMEFIEGIKVNDIRHLDEGGFDRRLIARRLIDSYFHQVFYDGFFHADPHPGNIFVLPGNKLCFIDFGMMGSILPKDREQLSTLFLAVRSKDARKIIRVLQVLSDNAPIRNFRALESDLSEFVHNFAVTGIHHPQLSSMMLELRDIVIKHNLKVPTHFFLLARSLVSVEGVCRQLDPEMNVVDVVRPHLMGVLMRRYDPIEFGRRVLNSVYEMGMYMEDFPREFKAAIRRINSGEMEVGLQHKGIDPFVHTLVRSTRIIISAVIVAALIVGSSLLVVADVGPHWKGTSVPAIIGFTLAAIIGFGMVNNLRKGDDDRPIDSGGRG